MPIELQLGRREEQLAAPRSQVRATLYVETGPRIDVISARCAYVHNPSHANTRVHVNKVRASASRMDVAWLYVETGPRIDVISARCVYVHNPSHTNAHVHVNKVRASASRMDVAWLYVDTSPCVDVISARCAYVHNPSHANTRVQVDLVYNRLEISWKSSKFQIHDTGVDEIKNRNPLASFESVMKQPRVQKSRHATACRMDVA